MGTAGCVIGAQAKLESVVARWPVLPLAFRAAFAAVASWLVVMPLGGVADDYPYYAPLGAVVAVSTTVVSSIRASVQTFLALGCGTCIGIGLQILDLPTPAAIGIAVGAGTVIGSWRRLGSVASWVPVSALFILVLGQGNPWHFVLGYLGLTTLGAVVGALVSIAVPPLQLAQTLRAQEQLRAAVVAQLEELATGIESEPLPTREEWEGRRLSMEPRVRQVQELVRRTDDAPRVNWRVRRWQDRAHRAGARGKALTNLAFQVCDLTAFLAARERGGPGEVPLGPLLQPAAAKALRATATSLRAVDGPYSPPDELGAGWRALDELADAVRREQSVTGHGLFAAGALVTSIERALQSVTPQEEAARR